MPRPNRILNVVITPADAWQKVYDVNSYKNTRIREVRVKLRETTTASYFKYNYDGGTNYMTSTAGIITVRDIKQLWINVPTVDSQVVEVEIIYQ